VGWPLEQTFGVDAGAGVSAQRFVALAPDGAVLLYWNATAEVARYETSTGRPMPLLELGFPACRCSQSRYVAGITSANHLRVYDLSSGTTLLDLPDKRASALCFSGDGTQIMLAHANAITTYEIATGKQKRSMATPLWPLAYAKHGNRFVAFQPEGLAGGGATVLADAVDGRVTAVLNHLGSISTPTHAFFSDSSDQLAIVRPTYAEVVRSVRPEELQSLLNSGSAEIANVEALPPIAAPVAKPAPLIEKFSYEGGYFGKFTTNRPAFWREGKTGTDIRFYFEEIERDGSHIMLKDSGRSFMIEIPTQGGMSRLSPDEGVTWRELYEVRKE